MKEIPLTQGKTAIVDDDMYDELSKYKWSASFLHGNWYAKRNIRVGGKRLTVRMHSVIIDIPSGLLPDHKNGNGLDNRRENLRACTKTENQRNQRKTRGTSVFKGVHWKEERGNWIAQIQVNHKNFHLGCFTSEIAAALAYDEAAKLHFGEFAKTNFIEV